MSLSYCVGLVYIHAVLVVRGVELSNDVEADALVKLSARIADGSLHMLYVSCSSKCRTVESTA